MNTLINALVQLVSNVLSDPRFIKLVVEKASGTFRAVIQNGSSSKVVKLGGKLRAA